MSHTTTHLLGDYCPGCGKRIDAATSIDGEASPTPGDVTVCAFCASVLMFEPGLSLRRVSDQELAQLPAAVRRQVHVLRLVIAGLPPRVVKLLGGRP